MTSLLARGTLNSLAALAALAPAGRFAEVGVYKGGSAEVLAKFGRELHLFDTFSGIPIADPDDSHRVGDFGDASLSAVRALLPDAVFHVGVFPGTLPRELVGFAFVHVDCDQYASTRDCIARLWPRVVPNGIMLFDDYDCTWGATRAVDESSLNIWRTPQGRAFAISPNPWQ